MSLLQILSTNLAATAALFVALWFLSLLRRDASVVDLFWGIGFVFVGWLSWVQVRGVHPTAVLLLVMVSIWGLRLSAYLTWRNWAKAEDYRYQAMRARHQGRFPLVSLFTVFLLQAVLLWVISWPLQVGVVRPMEMRPLSYVGLLFWACGLFFETVGDFQLARFKRDASNKGRVMNRGLWRYTRHPNYFGDFLVWWGIYLVAAETGSWWWTIAGPVLMSVLLVRVSGVRLLESSLRDRLAGYDRYVATTSAFFPRPPKQTTTAEDG